MRLANRTFTSFAAAAFLVATSGTASAAAIGTAFLKITDLTFNITGDGGTPRPLVLNQESPEDGDIIPGGSGLRNNGDTSAQLSTPETPGTPDIATGSAAAAPEGFDVGTSIGEGNEGFSCVGECTYDNNSFDFLVSPEDIDGDSYVVADVQLLGAAIDFIQEDGTVVPATADAFALAESAVQPDDIGTSSSNVGLNAQFQFIANDTFDLLVTGMYDAYIRAFISDDIGGLDADASVNWQFTAENVDDPEQSFSYNLSSDDGWVSGQASASRPGQDVVRAFGDDFSFETTSDFFQADQVYQFTIRHDVIANSQAQVRGEAPTPSTLALLAGGLLAAGIGRRRMRRG